MNSQLRRKALAACAALLATARDTDHTTKHVFPLTDALQATAIGQHGCQRLLDDPEISKLCKENYLGPWPSAEAKRSMPTGSLGYEYQKRIDEFGLEDLPSPSGSFIDSDHAVYINHRLRHTHELHHVVLGLPITVAGEAAISTYYAAALYTSSAVGVLAAWILHTFETPADHDEVWSGIEFGISLAKKHGPLILSFRWEEYWQTDLEKLRDISGLLKSLELSPFSG